jgi:hypothetical protein
VCLADCDKIETRLVVTFDWSHVGLSTVVLAMYHLCPKASIALAHPATWKKRTLRSRLIGYPVGIHCHVSCVPEFPIQDSELQVMLKIAQSRKNHPTKSNKERFGALPLPLATPVVDTPTVAASGPIQRPGRQLGKFPRLSSR